jgi:putative ABC transport system permease protein
MHVGAIAMLALRSLLNRRFSALLTLLAVAVSVLLFVGVEKIRQGARDGFERTISGADLIVGARSGPVNLVLFSIFHIGDPIANISWDVASEIDAREDVAWTIPIALGDSHAGFRVVGTSGDYFDHYQYGGGRSLAFASGQAFSDLYDVVLGAEVARALNHRVGAELVISHGLGEHSFSHHDDKPFTVAGVLAPTGTPVDRSLHVSLAAIEAIHLGWESGAKTPMARMMTADRVRDLPLEPDAITALIVGLKERSAVLRVQRELNTYEAEPLLAAIPAVALAQLWQVVGVVERTLAAISACVVAVGLIVILVSIMTALNERRREMAILRSVGARPGDVFFLLVAEAALLAFSGSLIGLAALYGILALLEPVIQAQAGVSLAGLRPGVFDLAVVGAVTLAAAMLAALPGWRAFRNALADGLSIRV